MKKTKNILVTVGIVILLAVIVYVRSRISPLFGNYSVEKIEKKVEAKPTMDTKSQETKKSQGKTETLQKGINSYWNMQGSGKVKFDASAGFYDEWGDIPALWRFFVNVLWEAIYHAKYLWYTVRESNEQRRTGSGRAKAP